MLKGSYKAKNSKKKGKVWDINLWTRKRLFSSATTTEITTTTTSVPFEAAKHLCMAQKLPEVNVKHVSCASKHDIVIVSITDA